MSDSQTTVDAATPAAIDVDVKPAESSPAETGDKGSEIKSTLDVIKTLQGPDKSPSSENGQETKSAVVEQEQDPEAKAKAAEEEWVKTLSKQSQSRFRTLNDSNKALSQENAEMKERVQRFEGYEQVIQQNQLSDEDVKSGFEIMGLIRSKPDEALKRMTPIIRGLLDYIGYNLPEDLKADVEAGALTQDRARELAAARNREMRGQQNAEAQAERQKAEQSRRVIDQMAKDADEWSANQKTSDPDWSLKQDRVAELVKLHVFEKGLPASKKDAIKLFDDMKKRVDSDLRKLRPNPQPKTVTTGDSSPSALPEAKTTLDLVRQMASGNRT